jgi:hypothetical protein
VQWLLREGGANIKTVWGIFYLDTNNVDMSSLLKVMMLLDDAPP